MAGTVTSYDDETGVLVFNATNSSGTDTLTAWSISTAGVPGEYAEIIGSSTTNNVVGTGSKTFTIDTGLDLEAGQYLIISAENSPEGWEGRRVKLEPNYLNSDDEHDVIWWENFGLNGERWDTVSNPNRYQILGTTIYVRPKPIVDVLIKGTYNAKPTALTVSTQTIPWNGLFDEIFIEGTVIVITQGVSIPESNQAFMTFFKREFNPVMYSRSQLIQKKPRTTRANFL
jgi:hypothetical protein